MRRWALERAQRLDPSRRRLPVDAERALRAAVLHEGMTLADAEAIGAWMESPRAVWWRERGLHVAGWGSLLGRGGERWRERLTEARAPPRRGGGAGFVGGLMAIEDRMVVLDVEEVHRGES